LQEGGAEDEELLRDDAVRSSIIHQQGVAA